MRHRNRIIRSLRQENARLRQQLAEDDKKYQSVISEVRSYAGSVSPRAAIDFVHYLECRNRHQAEQLEAYEHDLDTLRLRADDLRADRCVHVILILVLLLLLVGCIAYHWFF